MPDVASAANPRRERLLQALVDQVALHGYQATTIAQITASARVSRTTFYEHFTDKQDCFLVAYHMLAERVLEQVERALGEARGGDSAHAALGVLVELAEREPAAAVVLTHGAMAAGLPALSERNRLMARVEQAIERSWQPTAEGAAAPALPARALVGAAVRELAVRLHKGEPPGELLSELVAWVERYATQRTSTRPRPEGTPRPPTPTSGRRGSAPAKKARRAPHRSPRERILQAVAELVRCNGYPAVTVADVVAAASVNRETFYQHFADKESAYVASLRMVFERIMAATAGAFFGQPDWTERIWNGACGLVEFIAEEAAIAHVTVAEPYAVSGRAVDLTIELQFAFAVFLEEGYRYRPGAEQIPRVTSKLVVGAILELLDRHLREQPDDTLCVLAPDVAYLTLAPFTGADAASEFIGRKVAEACTSRACYAVRHEDRYSSRDAQSKR